VHLERREHHRKDGVMWPLDFSDFHAGQTYICLRDSAYSRSRTLIASTGLLEFLGSPAPFLLSSKLAASNV